MTITKARICRVAVMLVVTLLAALGTATAQADGYIISEPTPSSTIMADQKAVLVYRNGREDMLISIDLDLSSITQLPEMAWIIPVPSPPEIQVTDSALFEELDRLSAPEVIYQERRGGALQAGAPAPTVEVLERKRAGVYDVAVLAGQEGGALLDWLNVEGFSVPAAVQPALDAYVAEHWVFVAMRIAPDTDESELSSPQPVWISFDAAQMVYPMRLTGVRDTPLSLRLYILTDHRTTLEGFTTEFAGQVQVDAPDPVMASVLNREYYFTRLFDPEVTPAQMANDFYPSRATTDEPYREQVIQTYVRPVRAPSGGALATFFCGACWLGLALLLLILFAVIWILRRRRRRR